MLIYIPGRFGPLIKLLLFIALGWLVINVFFDGHQYNPDEADMQELLGFDRGGSGEPYYGNAKVVDIVSISHYSGNTSRVVVDTRYEVLEDTYIADPTVERDEDVVLTRKYSKGDTYITRRAYLVGRQTGTHGGIKIPYVFTRDGRTQLEPGEISSGSEYARDFNTIGIIMDRILFPRSQVDELMDLGAITEDRVIEKNWFSLGSTEGVSRWFYPSSW